MNKIFSWFKRPPSTLSLGQKLEAIRLAQGLSVKAVADAARLKESVILLLESDEFFQQEKKFESCSFGSARLMAVRYARTLGVRLDEIHELLPPLPPLNPPGSSFLKNLSSFSSKPSGFWKRQFSIFEPRVLSFQPSSLSLPSLKDILRFFVKLLVIVLTIIIVMYAWNSLRHLNRVIWSQHLG